MSVKNKIEELKKINGLVNNDRYFKVGDVVRNVGSNQSLSVIKKRGVGIVVRINGPLFEAYWVGDGSIRLADARLGAHKLQNIPQIPQIAEWVATNV